MKNLLIALFYILTSCSQFHMGEKNDVGHSYYFNSILGDNNNLGTKEKPLKSLDFIENIKLKEGDKILLANGSIFTNTINILNKNGIEVSNYMIDGNIKTPIINRTQGCKKEIKTGFLRVFAPLR